MAEPLAGLDQMGNLRFKSRTRSTKRQLVRWESSGLANKSFDVPNEMEKFDIIQKLGAADLFVCTEFHADWGLSDDPTDEQVSLFLIFSPQSQPQGDAAQMLNSGRAEAVDLQNWRSSGTLLTIETTPAEFLLKRTIQIAVDEAVWESAQFPSRFGMDLNILGVSDTLSTVVLVWTASGHRIYNLPQRSQKMREWQGQLMEEIFDSDGGDDE